MRAEQCGSLDVRSGALAYAPFSTRPAADVPQVYSFLHSGARESPHPARRGRFCMSTAARAAAGVGGMRSLCEPLGTH
jgi:hypothetical protein